MSRDIRSYFLSTGGSKKKDVKKQTLDSDNVVRQKKRSVIVLDSDSDEDLFPDTKKHKGKTKISDDSKDKGEKKSTSTNDASSKLTPVNVADVFGNSHVKRTVSKISTEIKKDSSNLKLQLEDQHSDSDFEATLLQIDEQELINKKEKEKMPEKHKEKLPDKHKEKTPDKHKEKTPDKHKEKTAVKHKEHIPVKEENTHVREKEETSAKSKLSKFAAKYHNSSRNDTKKENDVKSPKEKVETSQQKINRTYSHELSSDTPTKTQKNKLEDKSGVIIENHHKKEQISSPLTKQKSSDDSFSEDAFEKKRQHAIQYQRYLQREGPRNPGGKEIPEGKPDCLKGLVFVVTGVLETLDRDETASLIQRYGGRVTSNVSRNTSYLVVGDEPGPAKIEKAAKLNTKQLTEDGLLDLIRTSTGSSGSSEKSSKTSKQKNVKKEEGQSDNRLSLNDNKQLSQAQTSYIKKEEKVSVPENEKKASIQPSPPKMSTSISPATKEQSQQYSLWADKYKPVSTKQIIGQQGDRSNVKKLLKWLDNWHSNHSGKKKLSRPSPWAKDDSGAFFKAALLSGAPGVGKTTTAHLVCKELGFDVVEFNASDTRSKKLLHEEVSELLNSKSLSGFFQDAAGKKPSEKHVLVMDEVDGMAGNEDRGGMQELIQLIKNSHIPIICMCNDRHHPKVRSLTNYCFDLQFSRPRVEQIRGAMMSVCFKEGIKISPEALNDIITGANHDIRQVLHHLSMWSVKEKQLSLEQAKEESQKAKKNIKLGPWDVLRKVFSADAHKTMSILDKSDLFFHDYSLGPLFVQENYLSVMPHKAKGNRNKHLELVAKTSESLSTGDLVEKSIRSKNAWSLLPVQAMASSVLPGQYMEGHLTSQINFPAWLGKNSRRNKFHRLQQELHMHMRLNISGSKEAVNLDYLTHIRDSVVRPLIKDGVEGVPTTLSFMQNYYLTREDIDSILELSLWPNQKDPMSQVDSKVKAALTRGYNKEGFMTPYSIVNIKKLASKSSQDMEIEGDGDEAVEEEEEEGDISSDAMIKAKKRPASSREPSSSKAKKQKTSAKETTKKSGKGKAK
ncbi:replication factor C subunit 1 [Periplaneta americana]|uniref:replication factor C subunit 1 n=1 Tax=Periplaneta americana TaxID=6978 RepID=UPI0037E6FAB8